MLIAALALGLSVPIIANAASPAADQYGTTPSVSVGVTATVSASTGSGILRRCISRRLVRLTLPHTRFRGGEHVSMTALVINGNRRSFAGNHNSLTILPTGTVENKSAASRNRVSLDFRGLLKGSVTVDITLRTNRGSLLHRRTIFHPCTAGTASSHGAHHSGKYVVLHKGKASKGIARVSTSYKPGSAGAPWIALLMAAIGATALALVGRRFIRRRSTR